MATDDFDALIPAYPLLPGKKNKGLVKLQHYDQYVIKHQSTTTSTIEPRGRYILVGKTSARAAYAAVLRIGVLKGMQPLDV